MTVSVWNRCLVAWSLQQVYTLDQPNPCPDPQPPNPNESFVSVRLWERLDFHCHDLRDGPQDREWLAGMLIVDIWTPFIPRFDIFPRRVWCKAWRHPQHTVPKTHDAKFVAVLTPSTNSKDSLKQSPLSLFLNVEWTTPNIGCRESMVSQVRQSWLQFRHLRWAQWPAMKIARTPKMATFLAVQSPKAKEQKWRLVIRKEQLEHHAVMLAMFLSCFCHSFRSKDSGSHSYNSQVLALLGWMEAMDRCVLRLAIFVLEASKLSHSYPKSRSIDLYFSHTFLLRTCPSFPSQHHSQWRWRLPLQPFSISA